MHYKTNNDSSKEVKIDPEVLMVCAATSEIVLWLLLIYMISSQVHNNPYSTDI